MGDELPGIVGLEDTSDYGWGSVGTVGGIDLLRLSRDPIWLSIRRL